MTATDSFQVFGTNAVLIVTDKAALRAARAIADADFAAIDLACSRFPADSELSRLNRARGQLTHVSDSLATLVAEALRAAELTDGQAGALSLANRQRGGRDLRGCQYRQYGRHHQKRGCASMGSPTADCQPDWWATTALSRPLPAGPPLQNDPQGAAPGSVNNTKCAGGCLRRRPMGHWCSLAGVSCAWRRTPMAHRGPSLWRSMGHRCSGRRAAEPRLGCWWAVWAITMR